MIHISDASLRKNEASRFHRADLRETSDADRFAFHTFGPDNGIGAGRFRRHHLSDHLGSDRGLHRVSGYRCALVRRDQRIAALFNQGIDSLNHGISGKAVFRVGLELARSGWQ